MSPTSILVINGDNIELTVKAPPFALERWLLDLRVGHFAFRLAVHLLAQVSPSGTVNVSIRGLARAIKTPSGQASTSSIRRGLAELVEAGVFQTPGNPPQDNFHTPPATSAQAKRGSRGKHKGAAVTPSDATKTAESDQFARTRVATIATLYVKPEDKRDTVDIKCSDDRYTPAADENAENHQMLPNDGMGQPDVGAKACETASIVAPVNFKLIKGSDQMFNRPNQTYETYDICAPDFATDSDDEWHDATDAFDVQDVDARVRSGGHAKREGEQAPPSGKRPASSSKVATRKRGGSGGETWVLAVTLAALCRMDMEMNKGRLLREAKQMRSAGVQAEELMVLYDMDNPASYWRAEDWRGKKNQLPTPAAIRETYQRALAYGARANAVEASADLTPMAQYELWRSAGTLHKHADQIAAWDAAGVRYV